LARSLRRRHVWLPFVSIFIFPISGFVLWILGFGV
jgi:hypothetical protein